MNVCGAQKNTEPLISVIIPVYCAEATLPACLDSVLSQSLAELEVICVDDGSSDDSLSVLREYAQRDDRVRVLTQSNRFAGAARNRGMEAATGKYIAFLDADDLFLPGMLEAMHRQAEQYRLDMLKTGFVYEDADTGERYENPYSQNSAVSPRHRECVISFARLPEQLLSVADVPWNGLYRRDFLREHNIRFNHLRCVNDHSFFIHCLLKARRIMVSGEATVCYRAGQRDSLVGRRADSFADQIQSYRIVRELCLRECPRLAATVLEWELSCLFYWYGQLRLHSDAPEVLDGLMEEFVRSMDENDVGEVFLRSFGYKQTYYAMRYGTEAPERAPLTARICDRLRRHGVRYAFLRIVSSFMRG